MNSMLTWGTVYPGDRISLTIAFLHACTCTKKYYTIAALLIVAALPYSTAGSLPSPIIRGSITGPTTPHHITRALYQHARLISLLVRSRGNDSTSDRPKEHIRERTTSRSTLKRTPDSLRMETSAAKAAALLTPRARAQFHRLALHDRRSGGDRAPLAAIGSKAAHKYAALPRPRFDAFTNLHPRR